jgi:hypothetical protein
MVSPHWYSTLPGLDLVNLRLIFTGRIAGAAMMKIRDVLEWL